jgi:hypothetical protein
VTHSVSQIVTLAYSGTDGARTRQTGRAMEILKCLSQPFACLTQWFMRFMIGHSRSRESSESVRVSFAVCRHSGK